jgi:glycosyltransferase involved in cell wall biosynthesis
MKLSVLMPAYNEAATIEKVVRVVLATPQDKEIIVVDDGSTDRSVAVIERIAAAAPAIRLLRNPSNIGVIPTLQRGLQAARGRYVYFAASDDWVFPDFFALALRRLEADPGLGLYCGEAMLVDGRTNRPFAVRPAVRPRMRAGPMDAAAVAALLRRSDNWILTGSTVFRRDCVTWAGGFEPRLTTAADGLMARKIALRYGLYFEPSTVATWVVLPDSVSRQTARKLEHSRYMLEDVPRLIAADPGFPPWYAELFRNRWRFATCRLALQADPIDRDVVLEMGARSAAEKAEFATIMRWLPRQPARLVILAWLWYRLRPTSLLALMRTMLAMRGLRLAWRFRSGRIPSMTAPAVAPGDA